MEIYIYNSKTNSLPYQELRQWFNHFNFTENEIFDSGQVKQQLSGVHKYALITLKIGHHHYANTLNWEISENKIPIIYLDTILSTLKNIIIDRTDFLNITVIDGSYHEVDSSKISFEIATFMAIANMIGFEHEDIVSYK